MRASPAWKQAVSRKLRENKARTGDPQAINHTLQITSFGGCGTTALCDYLSRAGLDLPKSPQYFPFKHQRKPPPPEEVPEGFRAVYIYGDPRNVVVSLFRRDSQMVLYRWSHFWVHPVQATKERLSSLESFVEAGVDEFGLEDHLDRWLTRDASGYPVLFVQYEFLADVWPTVRDFVGLDPNYPSLPVVPRASDWRTLPGHLREGLNRMYEGLARRISELPPVHIG